GALPGGTLFWGIILAMLFEVPIAFTYVWLSTAMPRSGGDYVFQSRAFGGFWGFTILMSGFVIWILQWVALSGWLLSYLGFAPLFLGLGATLSNQALSQIGIWFTTPWGIIIVSILNALLSMLLLVSGFKNYVKFQYVMFYGILIAFTTMLVVLFTTPTSQFVERLNAFALASGGTPNFYQTAKEAALAAGIDLNPPFSFFNTLMIAAIAWTSLQWATYSAEQNGEIKDARSFKSQTFILVGSLIVTGILLALLGVAFQRVGGTEFLYIAGAGYWSGVSEATISGFWLWPNILAVALTASPIVVILIGIGYILNSFQIVNNCYIGVTRIMVAMSLDRLLPAWFSEVNEKFHTPVNAHIAYFLASIPVILLYNLYGGWASLTLGVTFACGYVFASSSLAGAVFPFRAKEIYEVSPGAKYKLGNIPWVTILGALGAIFGFGMVLSYLLVPALGLTSPLAYSVVFGIIIFSALWYLIVKRAQKARGIDVDYAFKEIPPD
ncbi:MAG: APC family permease, partial [Anaerolineales bacterium]